LVKNKKSVYIILAVIILAGFFLRFYELGEESIWLDEAYTLQSAAKQDFTSLISSVDRIETNPPFYFMMLHFWVKFFSASEFSIRFLSLLFSVFSIMLIYIIGKEIFNSGVGLLSSLMLASSMLHVLYSQEARGYSLFIFLILASFVFFIKLIRENKLKYYIPYAILTLLVIYTSYLGFLVVFFQNLAFLFFNKEHIKKWFGFQFLIGILYLPWLYYFIRDLFKVQTNLAFIALTKYSFPPMLANSLLLIFLLPAIVAVVVLLILFYKLKKFDIKLLKKIKFRENLFILFFIIFYIALFFVMPRLTTSIFYTRHYLFMTPFFYLFLAKGITMLRKKNIRAVMVIIILLLNIYSVFHYYNASKEQWRDVVYFVEETSKENEIILLDNADCRYVFDYYYKENLERIGLGTSLQSTQEKIINIPFSELQKKLENKSGIWLILSHDYRTKGYYRKNMDANYKLEFEKDYKDIKVYYYK